MFRLSSTLAVTGAFCMPGSILLWIFSPELGVDRVFSIYLLWISIFSISVSILVGAVEENKKLKERSVKKKGFKLLIYILAGEGALNIPGSIVLWIFSYDLDFYKELSVYLLVTSLSIGGLAAILNTVYDIVYGED
jgi:hypothetical protein